MIWYVFCLNLIFQCCAFKDINPCAPVHIIVVPKVCDGLTQLRYVGHIHCRLM